MVISSIQLNNNAKVSSKQRVQVKPYLEYDEPINTENNIKPLPPQGYLIHDNLFSSVKYFFKDIAYDFKSIKDGYKGSANDHQLGKLNDVGLKLGGIGIATYLASQTSNPKARIMEYVGLGAFLTSMSIYPKLAINIPAKIKHGFDIDKEYIDDQGRKKSVMQDSNYIPYDMYLAKIPAEDISIIGDRMGIPKDIKNRNDVIREQMRKISTQNNTLWMLTAGFATPIMSALICYGLENYVVAPALENGRISKYNKQLSDLLQKTKNMDTNVGKISKNVLSESVEKLLRPFIGNELPKDIFDELLIKFEKNLPTNVSEALKKDITSLLATSANIGTESVLFNADTAADITSVIIKNIGKRNKDSLIKIFMPSKTEIESLLLKFANGSKDLSKEFSVSMERLPEIKDELKKLFNERISENRVDFKQIEFIDFMRDKLVNSITDSFKTKKSSYLSDTVCDDIVNLAKILGDFKANQIALAECKSFKFEYASETVLARSYNKFEQTLIKIYFHL